VYLHKEVTNMPPAACGPQKNFVRPAKHSGETNSLELSLTRF